MKEQIYTGKRIARVRDSDYDEASKSDVGWKSQSDMPERITKVRFLLSDVVGWEEERDPYHPFSEEGKTLWVNFKYNPNIIIIEDIKFFDELMEDFISPDK